MLQRHVVKYHAKRLAMLTIAGLCGWFILASFPTAAKVWRHRAARTQEGQRPENLTTVLTAATADIATVIRSMMVRWLVSRSDQRRPFPYRPSKWSGQTDGVAFDSTGKLFGSTLPAGGFFPPPPPMTSSLVTLNPANGGLLTTVPITDGSGGPAISIENLSVQPGTDTLFGVRASSDGNGAQGKLYTINKTTG